MHCLLVVYCRMAANQSRVRAADILASLPRCHLLVKLGAAICTKFKRSCYAWEVNNEKQIFINALTVRVG